VALSDSAVTSNQVAAASGVATSTTSFSPGAGSLVLVMVSWMFATNVTATLTCKDSAGTTYTAGPQKQDTQGIGISAVFTHVYASAPGSITVKATCSNTGAADAIISPRIITGQASSQSGAATLTTNNASISTAVHGSITTTVAGSLVYVACDIGGVFTLTAVSGITTVNTWADASAGDAGATGRTTSVTGTPGAVTAGWTSSSSGFWGLAALEVLPVSGISASAGLATGTGTAEQPSVEVDDSGPAGLAAATGVAQPPVAKASAAAGLATATGTAWPASVTLTGNRTVSAGLATATGTAEPPAVRLDATVTAGQAAATGAALLPAVRLDATVTTGQAAATGAARPASVTTTGSQSPTAGLAAAVAAAGSPVTKIGIAAGRAAGAGSGLPVIFYATSPALATSGFGPFSQVPVNSAVLAVIANIAAYGSDSAIAAPVYELWDGASARIGAAQPGTATTSAANVDSLVFPGVAYSQLATLQLRVYARSAQPGNSGATESADYVALSVAWSPATSVVITPGVQKGSTGFPAPAIVAGRTMTPNTLAVTPAFPAVSTGTLLPGIITPVVLAAARSLPGPAVSTGTTVFPSVLARLAMFPAVLPSTAVNVVITPGVRKGGTAIPAPAIVAGRTVLPSTLAVTPAFPAVSTGTLLPGIITPVVFAATRSLPGPAVSTGTTVFPGVLARLAVFPAITDVSAPGYAAAESVLAGGSGSWANPAGIIGPPDGNSATWTVA
jgi:hypothetical protein